MLAREYVLDSFHTVEERQKMRARTLARQDVGPMLMIGFQGTKPTDPEAAHVLNLAREGLIGGIILFGHNIESPSQVQSLLFPFRETGIFIAVDQEGGCVQRLTLEKGFTPTPSAYEVGQGSLEEARTVYDRQAHQLHELGFNLIFGPVVDLHSPESAAIGKRERAYSSDPEQVVAYAGVFVQAHHAHGALTALKHFPGHGLAQEDSHRGLVDITTTFQDAELEPYRQLVHTGSADMIMTAHVIHQDYDPLHPATLSESFIGPLLREEMGYNGVVISDDLQMGAIAQHYSLEERVARALKAGVDIVLFSNNLAAAGGGAFARVEVEQVIDIIRESIDSAQLRVKIARIEALKAKRG